MRVAKSHPVWNRVGVHLTWLCVVLMAFYISRLCAKIESQALTLMICSDAYKVKSGSLLHDARISMIYRNSRDELRKDKNVLLGRFSYWITMKRRPSMERYLPDLEDSSAAPLPSPSGSPDQK